MSDAAMEHPELKDLERRQSKYWLVDGLPQIMTGLVWMLWGGLNLIGLSLLEGRAYLLYWILTVFTLFFWGYAAQWMLTRLKERITYPRAGYARIPVKEGGIAFRIVMLLWIATVLVYVFGRTLDLHGIGPFTVGALISLAIVIPAMRPWLRDIVWMGLLYSGVNLRLLDKTAHDAALCWMLVGMGLISTVVGLARLRRFLRENPKPAEAAE